MITAVPVTNDRIAGHFTKADSFIFINQQGRIVCHHINPARESGCAGKKSLLSLLTKQNAKRVITRNIGERMLGKLLALELQVFKSSASEIDTLELSLETAQSITPLTSPEQGRKSTHYEARQAEGGCGCSHNDESESSHEANNGGCHQHGGKKCCEQ